MATWGRSLPATTPLAGSTLNDTTYVSESFTPPAGSLPVVFIDSTGSTAAAPALTATGGANGLTFTLAPPIQQTNAAVVGRKQMWVANQLVPDSPVAMTLTLTFTSGDAGTGANIFCHHLIGMTRVGLDAIRTISGVRQFAGPDNNVPGGAAASVTLPAAPLNTNPLAAFLGNVTGSGTAVTAPSGFTANGVRFYSTPTKGSYVFTRNSGATSATITTGSNSTAGGFQGVEFDSSAPGGVPQPRAVGDSAPASDSVAVRFTRAAAISESAPAADSSSRSTSRARAAGDSAAATDSTSMRFARSRALSETAAATDALTRTRTGSRTLSDAAAAVDSLARSRTASRTLSDAAPASDALAKRLAHARALAESAPAVDALIRGARTGGRSTSDTAGAVDATARQLSRSRGISDSAPAVDATLPSTTGQVQRAIFDTAAAVDSTARGALLRARTAGDSAPAVDSMTATTTTRVSLGETATVADVVVRWVYLQRELVDAAPAEDATSAAFDPAGPSQPGTTVLAVRENLRPFAVVEGARSVIMVENGPEPTVVLNYRVVTFSEHIRPVQIKESQ